MEHREVTGAARLIHLSSACVEGIATTLKVVGIAAGYAAFVWFTMYQVEHEFSALRPFSKGAGIAAGSSGASVAGKGEIATVNAPALPQSAAKAVSAP